MRTYNPFPLIVLLLFASCTMAQDSDHKRSNYWLQKAEVLADSGALDSARFYYHKAAGQYQEQDSVQEYVILLNHIGETWLSQESFDSAKHYFQLALEKSGGEVGEMTEAAGLSHHNMGDLYLYLSDPAKARPYLQKALRIRYSLQGRSHPALGRNEFLIALSWHFEGGIDSAIVHYRLAEEVLLAQQGAGAPELASCYTNLSIAFESKGEYDLELEYELKSLNLRKERLGAHDQGLATSYNNLGATYKRRGDYDRAIPLFQKALRIYESAFGKESSEVATCHDNLGSAYLEKELSKKAIFHLEAGMRIRIKILPPDHEDMAYSFNNLGYYYYEKGEYQRALEYLQNALEIRIKVLGSENLGVTYSYLRIGYCLFWTGEADKALKYYQQALKIRKKVLGASHPDVADVYNYLGEYYFKKAAYTNSIIHYQLALAILAPGYEAEDYHQQPDLDGLQDKLLSFEALSGKAACLYAMSKEKAGTKEDLPSAVRSYKQAVLLAAMIRRSYVAGSRLSHARNMIPLLEGAIKSSIDLYQEEHDPKIMDLALYFSEQNKALSLMEGIRESGARSFGGIPNELILRERDLKLSLSFYEKKLMQEQFGVQTRSKIHKNAQLFC